MCQVFILSGDSPVWPNELTAGGGWLQTIQVPMWATEMRALLPSFLRPFEAGPHPKLTVGAAQVLRLGASTAGLPGNASMPLRARALQDDCPAASANEAPCLHVLVVNVLADTPVAFTVEVESPATVASVTGQHMSAGGPGINATRLFDDGYNVSLGFKGNTIILSDFIGPGDTNIYEIGCTGPKPRPTAGPGGRTISPPWLPCANRRVSCWDHTSQCSGV